LTALDLRQIDRLVFVLDREVTVSVRHALLRFGEVVDDA
jgi:hypothetical protein